jgi:hypothetical protein
MPKQEYLLNAYKRKRRKRKGGRTVNQYIIYRTIKIDLLFSISNPTCSFTLTIDMYVCVYITSKLEVMVVGRYVSMALSSSSAS